MPPARKRPAAPTPSFGELGTPLFIPVLEDLSEGAVTVDAEGRITWLSEKYRKLLGLPESRPVIGQPVEEIIPESRLREVVATGRPLLLDILRFGDRHFVVTRMPLRDASGAVTGAVGFVLYDRLDYLKPLMSRFESLRANLARAEADLAVARRARYALSQFIGRSARVEEVRRQARRSAASDVPVLLAGETGTGKELLAQAIHAASARAARPFVAVNMAAVPETLLEAEFFGVAPGAFTGAERRPREGKFQLAHGGTLFLDEIGDMPLPLQAKLLRALQEGEVEPLGSNRVVKVDIRVISATSHDLRQRVAEGRFRADLYYRLAVLPIAIPPLRERPEDLPVLCEALLDDITRRAGGPPREMTPDALALLARHDWPGNIRELKNLLERVCAMTDAALLDAEVMRDFLPLPGGAAPAGGKLDDAVARAEREAVEEALRRCGGNRAAAARLLGISRSHLYELLGPERPRARTAFRGRRQPERGPPLRDRAET